MTRWSRQQKRDSGVIIAFGCLVFAMAICRADAETNVVQLGNGWVKIAGPHQVVSVQNVSASQVFITTVDWSPEALYVEPINYTVALSPDGTSLRAATEVSVSAMLRAKGAPAYALNGVAQDAQTIYAAWVSDAILNTAGIDYLDLTMADHVMPSKGALAVMGVPTYG